MTTFHTLLDAAARLASDITINVRRLSPARRLLLGSAMLAAAIALPGAPAVAQHWDNARWQGAWGAAPAGPPPDAGLQTFNNQTMRLIVHLNARARAARIAVIGATLLPFEGAAYYSVEKEGVRQAVNAWIRSGDEFDAVIDFDRAMRDPGRPSRLLPAYDSGDHLHPGDLGYQAMGNAVPLELFRAATGVTAPPR